jgi:hypothetical protein
MRMSQRKKNTSCGMTRSVALSVCQGRCLDRGRSGLSGGCWVAKCEWFVVLPRQPDVSLPPTGRFRLEIASRDSLAHILLCLVHSPMLHSESIALPCNAVRFYPNARYCWPASLSLRKAA